MKIDSPTNPRIAAAARAIARGERVPLEGERMLGEALDAGVAPEAVYHLTGADPALLARAAASGAALAETSPRALARLSELSEPRGLVALAPLPVREAASIALSRNGLAVALDAVQDPVNVGAILRSAEAFGASAALLTEGCANPFGARALRASAGSALRIPVATDLAPDAVFSWARARGVRLVGGDAHGGGPLPERDGAVLLVIGSEGRGLSSGLSAALDVRVTIPLLGKVESLNASVAAGILLYALTRGQGTDIAR